MLNIQQNSEDMADSIEGKVDGHKTNRPCYKIALNMVTPTDFLKDLPQNLIPEHSKIYARKVSYVWGKNGSHLLIIPIFDPNGEHRTSFSSYEINRLGGYKTLSRILEKEGYRIFSAELMYGNEEMMRISLNNNDAAPYDSDLYVMVGGKSSLLGAFIEDFKESLVRKMEKKNQKKVQ